MSLLFISSLSPSRQVEAHKVDLDLDLVFYELPAPLNNKSET